MINRQKSEQSKQFEIQQWVHEAAEIGEADWYLGKRQAKRFAEGMRIEVALGSQSASSIWNVMMHNVSETGISFWTRHELDVGQTICVREFSADNSHAWLRARVKHKTSALQGFLIGLVFEL